VREEEITAFFDGFAMEPPRLVSVSRWRPGFANVGERHVWLYAGFGCIPA
jgi:hypothetical protein